MEWLFAELYLLSTDEKKPQTSGGKGEGFIFFFVKFRHEI